MSTCMVYDAGKEDNEICVHDRERKRSTGLRHAGDSSCAYGDLRTGSPLVTCLLRSFGSE